MNGKNVLNDLSCIYRENSGKYWDKEKLKDMHENQVANHNLLYFLLLMLQ